MFVGKRVTQTLRDGLAQADLDLTSTQGRTLVEFHAGFVSELKMLSAEQDFLAKQLAEALKVCSIVIYDPADASAWCTELMYVLTLKSRCIRYSGHVAMGQAADSKEIAANTLEIQHNHEVALELQARFTTASDKVRVSFSPMMPELCGKGVEGFLLSYSVSVHLQVLTEDQQKKLPGGGGTVLQPAQMEALCRALNVENAGAI